MGETTKTYAGKRKLPIPKFLNGILKEQVEYANKNETKYLFTHNKNLVNPINANARLKRIIKDTGMKEQGFSTHSLRHSYGTRCIESHIPPVVLQRLMGHTDIKITLNTYTEIFNKFKQEKIEKVNNYYEKNQFFDNKER